jgi:hypothetical protein
LRNRNRAILVRSAHRASSEGAAHGLRRILAYRIPDEISNSGAGARLTIRVIDGRVQSDIHSGSGAWRENPVRPQMLYLANPVGLNDWVEIAWFVCDPNGAKEGIIVDT